MNSRKHLPEPHLILKSMGLCMGGKNQVEIRSKDMTQTPKGKLKRNCIILKQISHKKPGTDLLDIITATQRKSIAINTWSSKSTWKCSLPARLVGYQVTLLHSFCSRKYPPSSLEPVLFKLLSHGFQTLLTMVSHFPSSSVFSQLPFLSSNQPQEFPSVLPP